MSDLEDLDHEPDDVQFEEELTAPAAGQPAARGPQLPSGIDKPKLMKAAAGLVVVVGAVGAYLAVSHHHAAASKHAEAQFPPSTSEIAALDHSATQKSDKPPSWNNIAPAPTSASGMGSSTVPKMNDLLPAAIPTAAASATTGATTAPSAPPVVNDLPPSSSQLADVGGAPAPTAAATGTPPSVSFTPPPSSATPSAAPSIDAQLPGMPAAPSAAPASAAAPTSIDSLPGMPAAAPTTHTASADTQTAPVQIPPSKPPVGIKNGEAMPSAPVGSVDIEADKSAGTPTAPAAATPTRMPVASNAPAAPSQDTLSPAPSADAAKVQELQKKVDDLEKTIAQLQQGNVVKEDTADKVAQEASGAAPAATHHSRTGSHKTAAASHHSKWVLKAAKPGVAWVAKKGSDDLQMVEAGDSLAGIGQVTEISRDSAGLWVVTGTKGRISQQ